MADAVERSVAHAGFTLARDYPASIDRVWAAFADEEQKRSWFGTSDDWRTGQWQHDFRVGGVDIAEGYFHGGPLSRYVARYTDIVEQSRIVTTYDMWLDEVHISTSVASYEFEPTTAGTRLHHTEHGIHLDGFDDGAGREAGSRGLHERLRAFLSAP